jgi:muramoyltetrapeptide carboxypeptidase
MVSGKVKSKVHSSINNEFFLQSGDLIEIVAPASACPEDVIQKGVKWIESHGFRAHVPRDLLRPEIYLSNSDTYRIEHLKKALMSKEVKAIWCVRGGFGASRLIPALMKLKKQKEKLFIGISDITTLHLFLNQKWGWRTLHASLLDRLAENKLRPENERELILTLRGEKSEFVFSGLTPLNKAAQKNAMIKSKLIGGNLTVLSSNIGTSNSLNGKSFMLFLEDLGERGYRIDRMLQQIKQSQNFKYCKAVLFGEFLGGDETNKENHVMMALKKFSTELSIPVFSGIEAGHGLMQRPLFFNTQAVLFSGAKAQLKIYNK